MRNRRSTLKTSLAVATLALGSSCSDDSGNPMDATGSGEPPIQTIFPYALILMDCQMPEMDGFEATQAIRQMET